MPDLSIVVLAYHQTEDTSLTDYCVFSVDKQDLEGIYHEKFLLDNGSNPPIRPPFGWNYIKLNKNVGNIEGQNEAFLLSLHEWVLFVSNDVRLETDCIKTLWRERFQGQLMPIILNPNLTHQSFGGRLVWPGYGFNILRRRYCQDYALDYVPSICYLMPKELWRNIGRFDERYPSAYEDVDMGLRLGSSRLKCSNSAFAVHLGNATLGYSNNKRFVEGRRRLINKHYKGVDRLLRLSTVQTLGHIPFKPSKVVGERRVV